MCSSFDKVWSGTLVLLNSKTKLVFLECHLLEKYAFLCWKKKKMLLINVKNSFHKLTMFVLFSAKEFIAIRYFGSEIWKLKKNQLFKTTVRISFPKYCNYKRNTPWKHLAFEQKNFYWIPEVKPIYLDQLSDAKSNMLVLNEHRW